MKRIELFTHQMQFILISFVFQFSSNKHDMNFQFSLGTSWQKAKKKIFLRRKTATQSINRKAAKAIESSTSCRVVVYEIIIGSMIIVNGKFFPFFFSSLKCWNVIDICGKKTFTNFMYIFTYLFNTLTINIQI